MLAGVLCVRLNDLITKRWTGAEIDVGLNEIPVLVRSDGIDTIVLVRVQCDGLLVDQDQRSGQEIAEEREENQKLIAGD